MISSNKECGAIPIRNAVLRKYFLGWALDQTAGGGRTKLVTTGRKTTGDSRTEVAVATVLTIGTTLTTVAAGPKLGAVQIEQECRDVCEFAG